MKRVLLLIALCIASFAAFFYLFVFPALIATHILEVTSFSLAFAAFLFLQLWMLTAEYAYQAAASIYNLRRKYLLPLFHHLTDKRLPRSRSGTELIFLSFLSYFFSVYAYGLLYVFFSHINNLAFSAGEALGLIDGVYFSFVTATTVGYGDIHPTSAFAKLLVMSQIAVSLLYVVFLFSALASNAKRPQEDET